MAAGEPAAGPDVIVHADAGVLARAAAARLITALVDAQAARGSASLVLTGGGIGVALLRAVRVNPAADAVDWSRVDIWWGDERFVAADSPDRNERQAREALLDHLPVDPARVFPMAPHSAQTSQPEAAAEAYAAALAARARPGETVPAFDVLLLGLGPEAHVASIFPNSPAAEATDPVVAVHDCPKPPPTRVSLTFPALRAARQVWIVVAGEEKAEAVAGALAPGAQPLAFPAAGAVGRERTLWLVDRAAASKLPG